MRIEPSIAREVGRLLAECVRATEAHRAASHSGSIEVSALAQKWFSSQKVSLGDVLKSRRQPEVKVATEFVGSEDERDRWFRGRIIESAKKASHCADLSPSADKWRSSSRR